MDILKSLITKNEAKILLMVVDGLGGLPKNGKTELEAARTPNLDQWAARSSLGLVNPVGYGITPGSGPGHLSLFGYDPIEHQIGRGILEALGLGLKLTPRDLCARANFSKIADGVIVDRRAGRIATDHSTKLCRQLQNKIKKIEDVEITIRPGIEHRFVVVFKGPGISEAITDSDPLKDGKAPLPIKPLTPASKKTARIVKRFLELANRTLKNEPQANYVSLRGFSKYPKLETMAERFGVKPACIASYPMYKGLAQLVGMELLDSNGWDGEIAALKDNFKNFDFFYLHFKEVDKMGEDGNFEGKVALIEELDLKIPQITALGFTAIAVTADHSTPAVMKGHSWHPSPLLLSSPYVRFDGIAQFSERACRAGSLGLIPATALMPLLLAHSLKLKKFGA
jgi:2,3-bisphosphoglycerate-independent phosphoglycerate mutase